MDLTKIRLKALFAFFFLYSICFFLISFLYEKILFLAYRDIVDAVLKPYGFNLHNSGNQHRLAMFDLWLFYKNLLISIILILIFVFIRIFRKKGYKEALLSLVLFLAILLTWGIIENLHR
jgi:hypothetical protein